MAVAADKKMMSIAHSSFHLIFVCLTSGIAASTASCRPGHIETRVGVSSSVFNSIILLFIQVVNSAGSCDVLLLRTSMCDKSKDKTSWVVDSESSSVLSSERFDSRLPRE